LLYNGPLLCGRVKSFIATEMYVAVTNCDYINSLYSDYTNKK